MNQKNERLNLLGNVSVPKALLAMGIPTMLGMMINALYNLVDAYFIGELGTSQMGAISIVYPLGQIIVGLGLLFGNGAASYISRLLGSGKTKEANTVANTALFSSLCVGAVMIFSSLLFLNPILRVLGATDSILPYARTYTLIYISSCILNIFNVTMNNLVTSEGSARITMCALLTGAILNIILDPVFIYLLHMGVAGAAIATAISQLFSTCVYLIYLYKKKSLFHFHPKNCCFSKEIMSEIFKIGIPTMLFQVLTSVSISLINLSSRSYGDSVIAGMGAVTRIISMGSLVVFGFIKGFQPIAGYSFGAKKFERLSKAIRISILWSTLFCVIYGLIMSVFAKPIVSQFTKDDLSMITTGAASLRITGLTFMLFGFCTVYSSLFLSLGKGKEGFLLGACRQGICFIPVILAGPILFGLNGILYAQAIADVLTTVVTLFMAVSIHRELNQLKQSITA